MKGARLGIRNGYSPSTKIVTATGKPETLRKKAEYYARIAAPSFAHSGNPSETTEMRTEDNFGCFKSSDPLMTLLIVVCNLRRYYKQDKASTVDIVINYYNRVSGYTWSEEAIELAWEEVVIFIPSLSVSDEQHIAQKLAREREENVVELIAYTRSDGRVLFKDLKAEYLKWYPEDQAITDKALGTAITNVTGLKSSPGKGGRGYIGLRMPTEEEAEEYRRVHAPDSSLSDFFFAHSQIHNAILKDYCRHVLITKMPRWDVGEKELVVVFENSLVLRYGTGYHGSTAIFLPDPSNGVKNELRWAAIRFHQSLTRSIERAG